MTCYRETDRRIKGHVITDDLFEAYLDFTKKLHRNNGKKTICRKPASSYIRL